MITFSLCILLIKQEHADIIGERTGIVLVTTPVISLKTKKKWLDICCVQSLRDTKMVNYFFKK